MRLGVKRMKRRRTGGSARFGDDYPSDRLDGAELPLGGNPVVELAAALGLPHEVRAQGDVIICGLSLASGRRRGGGGYALGRNGAVANRRDFNNRRGGRSERWGLLSGGGGDLLSHDNTPLRTNYIHGGGVSCKADEMTSPGLTL